MAQQRRKKSGPAGGDVHEYEFRRHQVRVEERNVEGDGEGEKDREVQLYIDGVEIPIEVTPRGVVSQDEMMFKEYGTVDELAEDIIRQRGTAEIVKGEAPHDHHDSPE